MLLLHRMAATAGTLVAERRAFMESSLCVKINVICLHGIMTSKGYFSVEQFRQVFLLTLAPARWFHFISIVAHPSIFMFQSITNHLPWTLHRSLVSACAWMFFAAVRKNIFISNTMNTTLVAQRTAGLRSVCPCHCAMLLLLLLLLMAVVAAAVVFAMHQSHLLHSISSIRNFILGRGLLCHSTHRQPFLLHSPCSLSCSSCSFCGQASSAPQVIVAPKCYVFIYNNTASHAISSQLSHTSLTDPTPRCNWVLNRDLASKCCCSLSCGSQYLAAALRTAYLLGSSPIQTQL